ncbi:unnamed protein product [Urochloa humidicola]
MSSPTARSPRTPNPPTSPAGDPPTASNATAQQSGNPPAATNRGFSSSPKGRSLLHKGEALDLSSCSGGSDASCTFVVESTRKEESRVADNQGKGIAFALEESKQKKEDSGRAPPRSVTGAGERLPVSFKDVLVGAKTFKPRFDNTKKPEEWTENTARRRPAAPSTVWARLGPMQRGIHDRLGERGVQKTHNINGVLPLLKARAVGRCFNCFASDHRIAQCRDPPRCVLCSRSGHKARSCPTHRAPSAPAPVWRRRFPAGGVHAPVAKKLESASPIPLSGLLMDFDPDRRPPQVSAYAARTGEIREAERELRLRSLIAVQMDAHVRLSCEGVLRDALQQLRIPASALRVSRISTTSFLLTFESLEWRNMAHSRRRLLDGPAALHLMPWGRQVSAAVNHLYYRAQICLEGVPAHAHNVESVLHLLPAQSFVEGIDYTRETEDEKGCFILWIWCNDPEALAVQGTLKIEEPLELPEEFYGSYGSPQSSFVRSDVVIMLQYNVIIHLDRYEDYSPPSNNSSSESFHSGISGLPSDVHTMPWPDRRSFVWHLGQPDVLPDPPRVSALSRLGGIRDRSPPRGGGAGGAGGGLRQVPPPNQFDMRSYFGHAAGPSNWGSQTSTGGGSLGHYRGHAGQTHEKETKKIEHDDGPTLLPVARNVLTKDSVDPMMEEALQMLSKFATHVQAKVSNSDADVCPGDTIQIDDVYADVENIGSECLEGVNNVVGGNVPEAQGANAELSQAVVNVLQEEENQINVDKANVDSVTTLSSSEMVQESVLSPVDAGCSQMNAKDLNPNKQSTRGISRLAVPLKRSLLCNPIIKPKLTTVKKCNSSVSAALKQRVGRRGSRVIPVEEKATAMLLKSSDIIGEEETVSEVAQEKFGEQFVGPLGSDLMCNMRNALGMLAAGGVDVLSTLMADTETDA